MVERTVTEPVTRRYCDFPGCTNVAEGMYSKCDKCNRDICKKHHRIWSEETCYCVDCHPMAKQCPHCGGTGKVN